MISTIWRALTDGNITDAVRIRERDQDRDHRCGERVGPRAIDPRPEHRLVVAQQQQEHRRAGQQQPGEDLHAQGQPPAENRGQHDGRRTADQGGVQALVSWIFDPPQKSLE